MNIFSNSKALAIGALVFVTALGDRAEAQTWRETKVANQFQIFAPPNNDRNARYSAVIVTSVAGSVDDPCVVDLIDDDTDGDADDSVLGASLVRGQSIVRYIRDGAYNDDYYDTNNPGVNTWDGDYFRVQATKPVNVQVVTDSFWQHDWVPAANGTLRGNTFYLFSNYPSRDINVIAYEDDTRVSLHDITTISLNGSGITQIGEAGPALLSADLDEGEDLFVRNGLGDALLARGRTYVVSSTRPVTLSYGAVSRSSSRDGGGFVPGVDGSTVSHKFYFNIPHDTGRSYEQELRVVAAGDDVNVNLYGWSDGTESWELIQTNTLDRLEHFDYVGGSYTLFRLETGAESEKVAVFEANWLETGAVGTSDVMSFASGVFEPDGAESFQVYLGPPGIETSTAEADILTHVYLFSKDGAQDVRVRDADTGGMIVDQTVDIPAEGYVDVKIDRSTYVAMNQPSSGLRPYLSIDSPSPIAVAMANWNDNWMAYATAVVVRNPDVTITAPDIIQVGQSFTLRGDVVNFGTAGITDTTLTLQLPVGVTVTSAMLGQVPATETRRGEDGTEVVFDIGALDVGDVESFTLESRLDAGEAGQLLSFGAVVVADEGADTIGATASAASIVSDTRLADIRGLSAVAGNAVVTTNWIATAALGLNTTLTVQRSNSASGTYTDLHSFTHTGSGGDDPLDYTDTTVQNNRTYYYRIKASDQAGGVVGYAGPVSARPEDLEPPPRPTITALGETGQVRVTVGGAEVADLAGYHIERKVAGGGWSRITGVLIGEGDHVDANVSTGTTYIYRTYATDTSGNRSQRSLEVSATPSLYVNRTTNLILNYEDMIGEDQNDWDYNDMVIRVQSTESYDTSGQLQAITIDYEPLARGAGYVHQLRQAIPVSGAWRATLTHYDATNPSVVLETSEFDGVGGDLDVEIFKDTRASLPAMEKQYANTDPAQASWQLAQTARLVVTIDAPEQNPTMATSGPWDLYIKIPYLDEPNEIHRASWAGATEALLSPDNASATDLLGGLASIPAAFQGATLDFVIELDADYITDSGERTGWAFEGVFIWVPFPIFIDHTTQGGSVYADWFLYPSEPDCVFSRTYESGQCAN